MGLAQFVQRRVASPQAAAARAWSALEAEGSRRHQSPLSMKLSSGSSMSPSRHAAMIHGWMRRHAAAAFKAWHAAAGGAR